MEQGSLFSAVNFQISPFSDSAADAAARDIAHRAVAGPQEEAGPQGGGRRQERLDAHYLTRRVKCDHNFSINIANDKKKLLYFCRHLIFMLTILSIHCYLKGGAGGSWLEFAMFYPLSNSAWADENLEWLAMQRGKMVEPCQK